MSFNTAQEAKQYIFNLVVRGLASQEWERCQSMDEKGIVSCTFNKGKPGLHCAIGWLIPWENQKELDPTKGPYELKKLKAFEPELQKWLEQVVPFVADKPEEYFSKTNFLRELMQLHDRFSTEKLCKQFMQFGETHKLTWPEEVPRA